MSEVPPKRPRRLIPLALRGFVRRAVSKLPSPRDEALLVMLRSTLDFIRGRPPRHSSSEPVAGHHESTAIAHGWLLVDAYERLGPEEAKRIFGHELDAWFDYARRTIKDLEPGDPSVDLSVLEGANTRLRYRRTLDFVRHGEPVFDVGVGRGYLCGLLLRDRDVSSYHGIDIHQKYLEQTRQLLQANDLDLGRVKLESGDLFELTEEQVAASGATFVICCEVLEHVADPEKGLATLVQALPQGTELLFSVPLNGRLESVWGHLTVFDVARLKEMTKAAGLHVHHVEPVANQWTFVIASRNAVPSVRVREAAKRPRTNTSVPLQDYRDFVRVEPRSISPASDRARQTVLQEGRQGRIVCRLESSGDTTGPGGLEFPVEGLVSLRFELGFVDFDRVTTVHVDAYAGSQQVGRWTWKPKKPAVNGYRRFAVRPGRSDAHFTAEGFKSTAGIDRIQVLVGAPPGQAATFSLRAAYIPQRVHSQ